MNFQDETIPDRLNDTRVNLSSKRKYATESKATESIAAATSVERKAIVVTFGVDGLSAASGVIITTVRTSLINTRMY